MSSVSAGVDLLNDVSDEQFTVLLEEVCSSLMVCSSQPDVTVWECVSVRVSGEDQLSASLGWPLTHLQMMVHLLAALILKCGVLRDDENLMECGVDRSKAEPIALAYKRHHHTLAPLLQTITPQNTKVVCHVSYEMSVDTCSSTQSRLCMPQLLLQVNTESSTLNKKKINTEPVQHSNKEELLQNCAAVLLQRSTNDNVLLSFNKQQLYEFYGKLEEIQASLDLIK